MLPFYASFGFIGLFGFGRKAGGKVAKILKYQCNEKGLSIIWHMLLNFATQNEKYGSFAFYKFKAFDSIVSLTYFVYLL